MDGEGARYVYILHFFKPVLPNLLLVFLPFLGSVSSAKLSQSFSSCKGSLSPFENVAWRQLRAAVSFHKRGRKRNICEGIPVAKFIVYAVKI